MPELRTCDSVHELLICQNYVRVIVLLRLLMVLSSIPIGLLCGPGYLSAVPWFRDVASVGLIG